ncbi:hypothetical protein FPV67DRAFT_629796 [Lyophyllum atratum]|nr:hypothetical protein FPV67DRAFT_629796 [Lyophyllum atratum]
MSIATLPQELVDQIIDHLHDQDLTLKACALVCRTWLTPCRSHIFRNVVLQPRLVVRGFLNWFKGPSHIASLYSILDSTPEVASFIRNLVIREGMVDRDWMAREKTLIPILRLLHNVERFELERAAAIQIAWRGLPHNLKGAISELLASPSLRELKLGMLALDDPKDLLRILEGCRSLRLLHIDHLRLGGPMQDESDSPDRPPQAHLDALTIGARTSPHIVSCLLHPQSTLDMTTLRKLSMSVSGNFGEFARLLRSTVSLEVLEIVLMSDIDLVAYQNSPSSERFDMSHNPNLRRLEVKIDVIQRQDDPLLWLNGLFSTFTTPNALQHIYIVYSLYLPAPYMDRSVNTTIFSEWQQIDLTLTGPVFDSLKQVRLEFSLENPIGFGVAPRFLKEVDLKSPALRAGDILVVEAFDTSR